MTESIETDRYPLLPLRDIVVFPHMMVPLFVGRQKSVRALEEVMNADKQILLAAQKNAEEEDPTPDDIHTVGTVGTVLQLLKLPDNTVKVLVAGGHRARIHGYHDNSEYFCANASELSEEIGDVNEVGALVRTLRSQFEHYVKVNKKVQPEVIASLSEIDDPSKLADTVAAHLDAKVTEKQALLEKSNVSERLEATLALLEDVVGVIRVEKRIRGRVKRQMEKTQREYYLNEQMKAIQRELGEGEDGKDESAEIEERIRSTKLSKEAHVKVTSELKKLRSMSPMSAEATVVRNYVDWILSIPWGKKSRISRDINKSESILDEDHYGLDKVKERILEYLAVQQRAKRLRGPILCLVGAPGVGKTSLGRSIARATGRNFARMSLGGVRDEAEIRGHRRTYIGSLPGKIIQAMRKVKTTNPLIVLDETDKLGADFRGDPASALLEVLDPEQNGAFSDHYLEIDYDLSDVLFITTANTLQIHPALLDRMEVIRISGYTEIEKLEIARRHLIPKQLDAHGLKTGEWAISEAALRDLIRSYTREAGVRNLERELASLARKATKSIVQKKAQRVKITARNLKNYAGIPRFRYGEVETEDLVGVTTGLAWTEFGGELLSVEALMLPGRGNIKITGKLGDVMQESVQAAVSYVQARSIDFGIKPAVFERKDIHVHVPEGATPKDGPSAGVAMATSIVSVLAQVAVRRDVAMTGEITLRGRVLPIGGLKEKLLAALRGRIKTVLIPQENEKDLAEISGDLKKGLRILSVSNVDEALDHALVEPPTPIEWHEDVDVRPTGGDDERDGVTTH